MSDREAIHADFADARGAVDRAEVEKFELMAAEWWDADGKFRPLHKFNPVRLAYVRDVLTEHFDRDPKGAQPLAGLRLLDIGCGGGLLTEPLTRLGAAVVGIDPSRANIEVARLHAAEDNLAIDYRVATAEELAADRGNFDAVLAMEVVEHVPDLDAFILAAAALGKPGGLLIVATINRTPKAYALAIVAAEYLLRWLPRGTHEYSKLVKPVELEAAMGAAGLAILDRSGVVYNPLSDRWSRSADMDVNYTLVGEKRSPSPAA